MTTWKHFSDPKKKQKFSVKINKDEINLIINDGVNSYYAQKITAPETYATKNRKKEIGEYIKLIEGGQSS